MATPSPVYLFKLVKHGTRNIQNDCQQGISDSLRVHQIRFRTGLRLEPAGGAYMYSTAPRSLAGLKGLLLRGRVRGGEEGARQEGKERQWKGRDPPSQIPGSVRARFLAECRKK